MTRRLYAVQASLALALAAGQAAAQAPAAPPVPSTSPSADKGQAPPPNEATPTPAGAQTPPASSAPSEGKAPENERKVAARGSFDRGVKLFRESAWAAALAELLRSRELYPTWSATSIAAVCLQKLQRHEEALEMFEILLREFRDTVPHATKEAALRAMADLYGLVGTIHVEGAEVGAAVVIDGQSRGNYPWLTHLRTSVGSHIVRVYKEGFEPFEKRVDVAGGQTVRVDARLGTLGATGRLRVIEQAGKALSVIVDGNVVGKTPWEGPLAVGNHMVLLRGEGELGTQPVNVPIQRGQVTPLSLAVEELSASIRIEPTPMGASVSIDSVTVGRGLWEGRLHAGAHTIEVAAEGFLATRREVTLGRDDVEVLHIPLERDLSAPMWRKPSRFTLEAAGAVLLAPSFGGDVAGGCGEGCSRSVGLGGQGVFHGGYELGSGFGFGITAGYLSVGQEVTARAMTIHVQGRACAGGVPCPGTVDDRLALKGFLAGAWAGFALGKRIPVHLRLGAGALIGTVPDNRTGTFAASDPSAPSYPVGPVGVARSISFLYFAPEARIALDLGKGVAATFGVETRLLIAMSRPTWDATLPVDASVDGIGYFREESLTGALVVLVAPSIGVRYAF